MKPELLAMLDEREQERYKRLERHRTNIDLDINRPDKKMYAGMTDALKEVDAECALYCKLAVALGALRGIEDAVLLETDSTVDLGAAATNAIRKIEEMGNV